jgi:hypothetical protein
MDEPDDYRPVSGLALAGLVVSALFAILIAASLAVGVAKGTPIFFPTAIVLVAVVGFGLSYAGHRQILTSEGTRVGVGIARLGMALAVVSGLGYLAFTISIGLAVAAQADDFLTGEVTPDSGFLKQIEQADKDPLAVKKAYFLTLPPSSRSRKMPKDDADFDKKFNAPVTPDGQGLFTIFRNSMLVRMLSRGGKIVSLGMRDWEHDKQSFKVGRHYRLETPEGTLLVTLQAESAEGEVEGQLRRWFVNFNRSGVDSVTLTPLGQRVQELREKGRQYLEGKWMIDVRTGKIDAVKLDESNWDALVPESQEPMLKGKNTDREQLRGSFHAALSRTTDPVARINFPPDSRTWPTWDHDADGRLWFHVPFTALLFKQGAPPMQAEGWVKLRTTTPMSLEKMMSPESANIEWEAESIVLERFKTR